MTGLFSLAITALLVSTISAQDVVCNGEDYIPHPTDCTLYYACSSGEPILKECPPGLEWNAVLNACDWPFAAGCSITTTTHAGPVTTSNTDGPTVDTTVSIGTEHPSTSVTDFPTEGPSTSVTDFPTEGPSTPVTDLPTEGPSTEEPPQTETEPIPTTVTIAPTTDGPATEPPGGLPSSCPAVEDPGHVVRLPHPTNCLYYYLCKAGEPVLYSCQTTDHFSPTKRVCRNMDVAGCDRCPAVDAADNVVRLPHASDCHLYYLCNGGEKDLYQCVSNWQFSRNVRECVLPKDSGCAAED